MDCLGNANSMEMWFRETETINCSLLSLSHKFIQILTICYDGCAEFYTYVLTIFSILTELEFKLENNLEIFCISEGSDIICN